MTETSANAAPRAGIDGYPGPFAVGRYAVELQHKLRTFRHVCIQGEVVNLRAGRGPNVWFELRDSDGAVPCAMWRTDLEAARLPEGALRDGVEVLAAGGCDFYPGGAKASPGFSFRVKRIRLAGEGDLLARLERLRRELAAEGLFERQKQLPRPVLPRSIGVVTSEGSAAARDLVAGLDRRSWRGRLVWGYAPVQDRRAAPRIAATLRELAAVGGVEAIVVTRGGGSIADLWAFCDEHLCRTVALLPVPVISAVGHEVDRTLIDDVAAVACSTPTHAAEVAVGVDCAQERRRLGDTAHRISAYGRGAVLDRARTLSARSRAPREHLDRHRTQLHQKTREMRASARRGLAGRRSFQERVAALVIGRKIATARASAESEVRALAALGASLERAGGGLGERRRLALERLAAALHAHDPDRTLERGYALALGTDGRPLASAEAVRGAGAFELRMRDGSVPGEVRRGT